ncbi:MAG TPA: hypothetical protein VGO46_02450 [Gemmatimonadaceae bacterium]|jgi:hypothetical protein|nr:hypothetical protein [Gemmatimonadaceae bacterium]
MKSNTKWLTFLSIAAFLLISFEMVTRASTIAHPVSTWLRVVSLTGFAVSACLAYFERPRKKKLAAASALCAVAVMLRFYTQSAAARTPAIEVADWVSIAAIFSGAFLIFAANRERTRTP